MTPDSVKQNIKARINFFVGQGEEALEKSLAHGLVYGKAQWWQHALDEMLDACAYCEGASRQPGQAIDIETNATIFHNLATTLHHLGHYTAALAFYEVAQSEMEKMESTGFAKCFPFLDSRPQQIEFMQSRFEACRQRRKPDGREYFSSNGVRTWTDWEVAAAVVEVRATAVPHALCCLCPLIEATQLSPQAKELEGEEKKSPALKLASTPRVYAVGSTPRQQLW